MTFFMDYISNNIQRCQRKSRRQNVKFNELVEVDLLLSSVLRFLQSEKAYPNLRYRGMMPAALKASSLL